MNGSLIVAIISCGISFVSILFIVLNFYRGVNKDNITEERSENYKFESMKESLVKANMKLDQLCTTTNETRNDVKSLDRNLKDIDKRLSIVERDQEVLFKRSGTEKVKRRKR